MKRFMDRVGAGGRAVMMPLALAMAAGFGGVFATAATAAPQPYACYYNPTMPCYTATGHGGSAQDINPVEYVFGVGGSGSIAYANNDHGGTVFARTAGSYQEDGHTYAYRAQAQLKHFIDVIPVSGPIDALVPVRITAFAVQQNTNGQGDATYTADQAGRRLVGRSVFADPFGPERLFDISQIVYVTPNLPIEVNMLASATGNMSVMVDPIYEIVGDYAARYRLSGLLSSNANGAVPEPATWALLLLGFGGIGAALRRRGARPAAAA